MNKLFIALPVLFFVFYILYINGLLVINAKSAVMYVGSQRGFKAKFSSCSGYTKRVIRFKESKSYKVFFNCKLEKGEVEIELLDNAKQKLASLNTNNPIADINVDKNKRYYLVIRFLSATGSYVISCE